MRVIFLLIIGMIFSFGCARVRIEVPREPIKVDISMRLDIYQHIQKDIDAIEDIVSGSKKETMPSNRESLLDYLICNAYAQEELSPQIQQAALRRKDRYSELVSWMEKGVIGENKSGLVEIRNDATLSHDLEQLVKAENDDRMIIYQALAKNNKTSVENIQKIYAERLQKNVSSGTPIEVLNDSTGVYEWKIK